MLVVVLVGNVWRYQRGYQKLWIEEQTIQWSKEKGQKNKGWSTRKGWRYQRGNLNS